MENIPEGFEPLFRSSPFLDQVGPLYYKRTGEGFIVGMRVLEKHTNVSGTMHGGLICTLADISLGYVTAFSQNPPIKMTTANLSVDFVGAAKLGDWVEAHISVQKVGSRLAFTNGVISTPAAPVARVSAVFLVVGVRKENE